MKHIALISFLAYGLLGQDLGRLQLRSVEITEQADAATAAGRYAEAEAGYLAALKLCAPMPPEQYHCRTDILRNLALLYSKQHEHAKAEATYKERLDILRAHPTMFGTPELDLGIAIWDMQSVTSEMDASRSEEEVKYMEEGRRFYENCKVESPILRDTCDRRLADVEGLHGALLVTQLRYDEAVPFLKAVINRPDSGVRKEVLVAALRGYATILIAQGKSAEAQQCIARARRLEASGK